MLSLMPSPIPTDPTDIPHAVQRRANEAHLRFERIVMGKGISGRPIYKHLIYGLRIWQGYKGLTFPSVREAITRHRWQEAGEQIKEFTRLLNKATSKTLLYCRTGYNQSSDLTSLRAGQMDDVMTSRSGLSTMRPAAGTLHTACIRDFEFQLTSVG